MLFFIPSLPQPVFVFHSFTLNRKWEYPLPVWLYLSSFPEAAIQMSLLAADKVSLFSRSPCTVLDLMGVGRDTKGHAQNLILTLFGPKFIWCESVLLCWLLLCVSEELRPHHVTCLCHRKTRWRHIDECTLLFREVWWCGTQKCQLIERKHDEEVLQKPQHPCKQAATTDFLSAPLLQILANGSEQPRNSYSGIYRGKIVRKENSFGTGDNKRSGAWALEADAPFSFLENFKMLWFSFQIGKNRHFTIAKPSIKLNDLFPHSSIWNRWKFLQQSDHLIKNMWYHINTTSAGTGRTSEDCPTFSRCLSQLFIAL